jgi:uncharacterized protein (TIGR02271 family)
MATSDQSIVIGIFDDSASADKAVDSLKRAGFSNDQIHSTREGESERGPLSGIKALFSGERAEHHKHVMDDLVSMGVNPEDARIFEREYEQGHPLVSVTGRGNMREAITILANQGAHGPEEYARRGTEYGTTGEQAGMAGTRTNETQTPGVAPTAGQAPDIAGSRTHEAATTQGNEAQKLRLHAERLKAYKQPEEVGRVSIHKDIVTEQQTLNVPVTREEVVIERHPVSEGATASEESIGQGETIRIPVSEERVHVTKETVPTGEVEISKRQVQENRQVSESVRREEARLEKEGDVSLQNREANQPPDQPQR